MTDADLLRPALRAHVATEMGCTICDPAVLREVDARLQLAVTSPEQARANAVVVEAARMMLGCPA